MNNMDKKNERIILRDTEVYILNYVSDNSASDLLLYSPLTRGIMRIPRNDYDITSESIPAKPEYEKFLSIPRNLHVDCFRDQKSEQLVRFSLIPTFKCNFSCSYCYSARGRSSKTLSIPTLNLALEHFLSRNRTERKDRYISIVGGGEPLIVWEEITRYAVYRIRELEKENDLDVSIGLTTNGSLITDEIIDVLLENKVKVSISFELLRDIQNLHRKNYDVVINNIFRLLEKGVTPIIRMTITPQNVNRLVEAVHECARLFPGVHIINMEYAVDKNTFSDASSVSNFFSCFTDSFFEAFDCGKLYGIQINTSIYRNMQVLADRFCSGDFCLTPDGYITACHRFTSPRELHFSEVTYGTVKENRINISSSKFSQLMTYNIYREKRCNRCPVRWHCGGTCLSLEFSYDADFIEAVCSFKRNFLARYLSEKVKSTFN